MDIKWKSYSHSVLTKVIVFMLVIVCFTGAIATFVNTVESYNDSFDIVFEDSYLSSREYMSESNNILMILTNLINEYKNEQYILNGESVTEEEIRRGAENLFSEFQNHSGKYNPDLTYEENFEEFIETNPDKITEVKEQLILEDLRAYHDSLQRLNEFSGLVYYASDGENVFTNSANTQKEHFKSYPSFMIFDKAEKVVYPTEIKDSDDYHWITRSTNKLDQKNVVYISFTEEFLNLRIKEWKEDKVIVTNSLYRLAGFLVGLMLSFIYLVLIIGRKAFKDKEVHLNAVDRLYNDINLVFCFGLITLWVLLLEEFNVPNLHKIIIPVTAPIAALGLVLVLSLVKHFKNKTILKHTLIYSIFYKIFKFIKDVYDSGSVGVKIVLIVIGYPALVAITFFMFPVTIGVAAWLAHKRVKEFNAIKEGVERIKNGDIHHNINVKSNGEFGKLASNINSIKDGLSKAVDNELKSERLKTELITNVSHDIRTPLTSIITYVDLLKKEKDHPKSEEYIEIIDQKAQRLKMLTEDLFEAAKASSGNIPVNYERIDVVSLITQGLGELNDRIEELGLEFKINHSKEKIYVTADGNLLWRAIENLLSNIFKYALKNSRVYIDMEASENEVRIIFKNISAYELNISADELMERFKRGDESRSSHGSGLGLSIAKSLVEIQRGSFTIQIDGDLFKAKIQMPRCKKSNE